MRVVDHVSRDASSAGSSVFVVGGAVLTDEEADSAVEIVAVGAGVADVVHEGYAVGVEHCPVDAGTVRQYVVCGAVCASVSVLSDAVGGNFGAYRVDAQVVTGTAV